MSKKEQHTGSPIFTRFLKKQSPTRIRVTPTIPEAPKKKSKFRNIKIPVSVVRKLFGEEEKEEVKFHDHEMGYRENFYKARIMHYKEELENLREELPQCGNQEHHFRVEVEIKCLLEILEDCKAKLNFDL
jgi:hypothetical protein